MHLFPAENLYRYIFPLYITLIANKERSHMKIYILFTKEVTCFKIC